MACWRKVSCPRRKVARRSPAFATLAPPRQRREAVSWYISGLGPCCHPSWLDRPGSSLPTLFHGTGIYFYQEILQPCRVDVSPTDVSPTESSWMLRPLNKASLEYCVPDRCVPTLDRAPSHYGLFIVLVAEGPVQGRAPISGKSVPTIFHLLRKPLHLGV